MFVVLNSLLYYIYKLKNIYEKVSILHDKKPNKNANFNTQFKTQCILTKKIQHIWWVKKRFFNKTKNTSIICLLYHMFYNNSLFVILRNDSKIRNTFEVFARRFLNTNGSEKKLLRPLGKIFVKLVSRKILGFFLAIF